MTATLPDREGVSVDEGAFRRLMGTFCTGVAVVTGSEDGEPIGFTCQSLTSVSLDPPLVSLCPALTSSTWPRVRRSGHLLINVLDHEHAEVSNAFARSGGDKFAGVDWHWTADGLPALDGAFARIRATVVEEYPAGDHTIAVCRVADGWRDDTRAPLLFFRSRYAALDAIRMGC